MGMGCKPIGLAYIGSNPIAPTISYAGVAQLVEHQPSKLRVASSNLVSRSIFCIEPQKLEMDMPM